MDIFIALIPALCWGNIGLVSRIMGGSAKEQTIGMTWGAFSLSLILTLIFKDNYLAHCTAELWITGFLTGFFWCAGQFLQFTTLKAIGISKGYPLSTGSQLILNSLAGTFIFFRMENRNAAFTGMCGSTAACLWGCTDSRKRKSKRIFTE